MTVVAFRADASESIGAGHVMRCCALVDEVRSRGDKAVLIGDLGALDWLRVELATRKVDLYPAPADGAQFGTLLTELAVNAVVIDAHHLPRPHYHCARRVAPVLAICDGKHGFPLGDLVLDHTPSIDAATDGRTHLSGPRYALIRDSVREFRPAQPRRQGRRSKVTRPRVLVVLGGTDVGMATADLVNLVFSRAEVLDCVAISARPLRGVVIHPGQNLTTMPPTPELAELAIQSDLVISAAGNSIWELCCVGAPVALTWVSENQQANYHGAIDSGCAYGLGSISEVRAQPKKAGQDILSLLSDDATTTRLAANAWNHVDGLGRRYVLDALYSLGCLNGNVRSPYKRPAV